MNKWKIKPSLLMGRSCVNFPTRRLFIIHQEHQMWMCVNAVRKRRASCASLSRRVAPGRTRLHQKCFSIHPRQLESFPSFNRFSFPLPLSLSLLFVSLAWFPHDDWNKKEEETFFLFLPTCFLSVLFQTNNWIVSCVASAIDRESQPNQLLSIHCASFTFCFLFAILTVVIF